MSTRYQKTIFICFLIVILVCFQSKSEGADWKMIGERLGNGLIYYNTESIESHSEYIISVLVKMDLPAETKKEFKGAEHVISKFEIDCVNKKRRIKQSYLYQKDGTTLDSYSPDNPPWKNITSGSRDEYLYEQVCPSDWKNAYKKKEKNIAKWELIGESNNRYLIYMDVNSLTSHEENIVKCWIKRVTKDGSNFTEDYHHSTDYMEFNCSENKRRIEAIVTFNKKGEKLKSFNFSGTELYIWVTVEPESLDEELLSVACVLHALKMNE